MLDRTRKSFVVLLKRLQHRLHRRTQIASHPFAHARHPANAFLQNLSRLVLTVQSDERLAENSIRCQMIRRFAICKSQMLRGFDQLRSVILRRTFGEFAARAKRLARRFHRAQLACEA